MPTDDERLARLREALEEIGGNFGASLEVVTESTATALAGGPLNAAKSARLSRAEQAAEIAQRTRAEISAVSARQADFARTVRDAAVQNMLQDAVTPRGADVDVSDTLAAADVARQVGDARLILDGMKGQRGWNNVMEGLLAESSGADAPTQQAALDALGDPDGVNRMLKTLGLA